MHWTSTSSDPQDLWLAIGMALGLCILVFQIFFFGQKFYYLYLAHGEVDCIDFRTGKLKRVGTDEEGALMYENSIGRGTGVNDRVDMARHQMELWCI